MKSSPLSRNTELRSDPEMTRAFVQRGRASSAKTMSKRRPISPASPEQRARIKGCFCIVTGDTAHIDPAHVVDRSLGGCDDRLCVVPLRRDLHEAYDAHGLDLLPYLEAHGMRAELAHAVTHLGLLGALQRITNVDWRPVSDGRLTPPASGEEGSA